MNIENSYIVVTDLGWPSNWFYNAMEETISVVYLHTHGEAECAVPDPPISEPPATWMLSDLDELGLYPEEEPDWKYFIVPDSILYRRQLAIGSGTPPFNSTGKPPIWLAFNDGCKTGNDNAFAEAYLWPYTTINGDWCANQAQCGWSIYKTSNQTKPCMEVFWGYMADGWHADKARIELYDAYQGLNKPLDPRDLVHVYGDWNTRLHGVYTGTPGQETRWFL